MTLRLGIIMLWILHRCWSPAAIRLQTRFQAILFIPCSTSQCYSPCQDSCSFSSWRDSQYLFDSTKHTARQDLHSDTSSICLPHMLKGPAHALIPRFLGDMDKLLCDRGQLVEEEALVHSHGPRTGLRSPEDRGPNLGRSKSEFLQQVHGSPYCSVLHLLFVVEEL